MLKCKKIFNFNNLTVNVLLNRQNMRYSINGSLIDTA